MIKRFILNVYDIQKENKNKDQQDVYGMQTPHSQGTYKAPTKKQERAQGREKERKISKTVTINN
jgi:hypothetical protein